MTTQIAFTGTRHLTRQQERKIYYLMQNFFATSHSEWHIGDAPGLDSFIQRAANYYNKNLVIHSCKGNEKWHFAERSQRMIDAIAQEGNWLYGFPDKLCPSNCTPKTPFSGHKSGTWGTIAYARKKGLHIHLLPLFPLEKYADTSWLPDWLKEEPKQLSLF